MRIWTKNQMITEISRYSGSFAYLYKHGAQLLSFSDRKGNVTVDNDDYCEVSARICDVGPLARADPHRRAAIRKARVVAGALGRESAADAAEGQRTSRLPSRYTL